MYSVQDCVVWMDELKVDIFKRGQKWAEDAAESFWPPEFESLTHGWVYTRTNQGYF